MDGSDSSVNSLRISVACAACRSKKRKCSGDRPTCAECQASGLICDWPKQMKRGPAKNYIRTLEARLNMTEYILRKLLEQVSDEQLLHTLQATEAPGSDARYAGRGSNAELWQAYPLTDLDNIRAWQRNVRIPRPASWAPSEGRNPQSAPGESLPRRGSMISSDPGHSTIEAGNTTGAGNRNDSLSSKMDNQPYHFEPPSTEQQQEHDAAQEGSSAFQEFSVELLPTIVDGDDIPCTRDSDIRPRRSSIGHQHESPGENREYSVPLILTSFQKQYL